ncbi:MAG: sigma factor [Steroidobacteraceae bacterium]
MGRSSPEPRAADNGVIERWLARRAKCERDALEELYGLTSARLFGVLMHILKRRELAEDALQDVFVRVWQRAGQFASYRGRATAWLVSIARYRAIDQLRGTRTLLPIDEYVLGTLRGAPRRRFEHIAGASARAAVGRADGPGSSRLRPR